MVVVVPRVEQKKHVDGSFVKVSSEYITKRARDTLEAIAQCKINDTARLVARLRKEHNEEVEKKRKSLWSRLFGYKEKAEPTDDELIKKHQCSGEGIWLPETFWIDFRYSAMQDVACRLINAAKHSDEVFVSTEDLERLV